MASGRGITVRIWDVGQLQIVAILESWSSIANSSPDGGMLLTCQIVDKQGSLYGRAEPTGRTYLPSIFRACR